MGLFQSKEDKKIAERMSIKKTIKAMNNQIDKLEEQKKEYIEKAKRAKLMGLNDQLNLAISGLKMCIAQQKRASEMLLNFEIVLQMKDMGELTKGFLSQMGSLSKDMSKLTNNKEFTKIQAQFEKAMNTIDQQQDQMDMFLDLSQSSFSSHASSTSKISDSDIMQLVDMDEDINSTDVDNEIEDLKKKLMDK